MVVAADFFFFFFSSRRRHTRWNCDWSSDVCSSDLGLLFEADPPAAPATGWSAVTYEENDVGRVTSIAWLPDGGGSVLGRWVGLAIVRREVPISATVRAAGREARVVALPFDAPY